MALKITGRASLIPGGSALPLADRGAEHLKANRAPVAVVGALEARVSAGGPMAPRNAAVAARLRQAMSRPALPDAVSMPLPVPALASPVLKPRRRPVGTGAAAHPDEAQDLLDLPDLDEQRDVGAADDTPPASRQRAGGALPPGRTVAANEPRPTTRADAAQAVKLQFAAIGSSRRAAPHGPRIPYDGNSFMNSLVHTAAAMLRQNIALPSSAPLSASMLRRHMTIHMIDVFTARNADPVNAGKPYGLPSDAGGHAPRLAPQAQRLLVEVLGERQAARCAGLSAAQASQVLDMTAANGARRGPAFAAILPQVATEAFAGLRLEVSVRGRAPVVYGSGDGPVHAFAFNTLSGRYEPAGST